MGSAVVHIAKLYHSKVCLFGPATCNQQHIIDLDGVEVGEGQGYVMAQSVVGEWFMGSLQESCLTLIH